ncbi:MAG: hypothetical protein GC137_02605 [Alphaproteobacteria bacterium]|nr:hypothetical protein [Alphaproteobacteria bacterium]
MTVFTLENTCNLAGDFEQESREFTAALEEIIDKAQAGDVILLGDPSDNDIVTEVLKARGLDDVNVLPAFTFL